MQKLTSIRQMQLLELGILEYLASVCEKHALRWFLIGGTLIGAVRHKGFIPWDDDIDVALPRPDYDKLLKILDDEPHLRYKLMTLRDGSDYFYEFSKITDSATHVREPGAKIDITGLGLFIDVYPLDGMGYDYEQAKRIFLDVRKRTRKIASCVNINKKLSPDRIFIRSLRRLRYAFGGRKKHFENIVGHLRDTYAFDECPWVASTFGIYGLKDIYPREIFASALTVPFENGMYPIPVGYDAYLTQRYGDYMRLPPPESRVIRHSVEVCIGELDAC